MFLIEVKHLTKIYNGGVKAVDDISFTIEPGKIYGFLGPNGAGKSTTMNIITGYLAATSGTVTINGFDIYRDAKKAKACIGYLPEQPPLYQELTPREYLEICAGLKHVPKAKRAAQIKDAVKRTGLEKMQDRLIRSLSKGYKQRVGLAQALIGDPDIIILDEPTVGLDPIQIIEIRDLIKSLKKTHTVILSSHILSEIEEICDSIIIIDKGRLKANNSTENIGNARDREVLLMTVRGKQAAARSVILGAAGDKVKIGFRESAEPGCIDIKLEHEAGLDLREELSYAFAMARIPVLAMSKSNVSLEDVFIEYTTGGKSDEPTADAGPGPGGPAEDKPGEAPEENAAAPGADAGREEDDQ